jgi:tetratricopeptide (TPR) repeat protein
MRQDWSIVLKAESLLAPLRESPDQLSRYERCKLDLVTAIAWRPNRAEGYEARRCMVQEAPGSDEAKYELAGTLMRLNRPAEAIRLYRELDPDRGLMKSGALYSIYLGIAYHMLGNYEGQLEAAQEGMRRFPGSTWDFHVPQAVALAALGRLDDLATVLDSIRSAPSPDVGWRLRVAGELRAHGHGDQAREVLDEAIAWFQARLPQRRWGLGVALYNAERWDEAERVFRELAEEIPECIGCFNYLGLLAARRGDRAEVARITELHRSATSPFIRSHTLFRASVAALLGEREQAMMLLQQWMDLGLAPQSYVELHRNIDFESLRDYPPFQEFMRPKG